jgi:hypothetical protein
MQSKKKLIFGIPFSEYQLRFLISLCFICMPVIGLHASNNGHTEKQSTGSEVPDQLMEYFKLSKYYAHDLGDYDKADSINLQAIALAEMTMDADIMIETYLNCCETMDLGSNYEKNIQLIKKAERLIQSGNPDLEWKVNKAKVNLYLSAYDYTHALESAYRAFTLSELLENGAYKAESYLLIGRSLEGKNLKIESFRNYLFAVYMAEKVKDKELLIQCYWYLSRFFNMNKYLDKAIEYKLKQAKLLTEDSSTDSIDLIWIQYEMQEINYYSGNNQLNEAAMNRILKYATSHHYKKLKEYTLGLYRTHLIEAKKYQLLYELYNQYFTDELMVIKEKTPALFFRLKAYFAEYESDIDSALFYLDNADSALNNSQNKIMLSNFNYRYGQFFYRQDNSMDAIDKYKKALDLAAETNSFQYIIKSANELETIYRESGDFESAYKYRLISDVYRDSIANNSQRDELLKIEIDNETRQNELLIEMKENALLRRHNLQYMGIVIAIATLFTILIMLGSFRIPEWVIRMLGFFSFIFLFEFIILIADHRIHDFTHGEPWKIMLIKIFLIALLLPFHHWIEAKVTNYLVAKKLVNLSNLSFRKWIHKFPDLFSKKAH